LFRDLTLLAFGETFFLETPTTTVFKGNADFTAKTDLRETRKLIVFILG
jgi:hypothetical protein